MRFIVSSACAIVAASVFGGAASAHHSFVAEFDPAKPKTVEGTVTELQWENPHTRFYMLVKNPSDPTKYDRWEVELGAPNTLVKYGWNRRTLGPGMVVTVAGFMARDGHNYMNSLSVKLPTGQTVLAGSSYRGSAEVVKPSGASSQGRAGYLRKDMVSGMLSTLSQYGAVLAHFIETSRPSIFLQNLRDEVEITQSLHLIAIALIMGSAVMINLRLLGWMNRDQSVRSLLDRFIPSLWIGVGLAVFTGFVMIMTEPARALPTAQFQFKMLSLLIAVGLVCFIQRLVPKNDALWRPGVTAKLVASVSLSLWALIIVAGRWIAYA